MSNEQTKYRTLESGDYEISGRLMNCMALKANGNIFMSSLPKTLNNTSNIAYSANNDNCYMSFTTNFKSDITVGNNNFNSLMEL